jgi:hypothetical protein
MNIDAVPDCDIALYFAAAVNGEEYYHAASSLNLPPKTSE